MVEVGIVPLVYGIAGFGFIIFLLLVLVIIGKRDIFGKIRLVIGRRHGWKKCYFIKSGGSDVEPRVVKVLGDHLELKKGGLFSKRKEIYTYNRNKAYTIGNTAGNLYMEGIAHPFNVVSLMKARAEGKDKNGDYIRVEADPDVLDRKANEAYLTGRIDTAQGHFKADMKDMVNWVTWGGLGVVAYLIYAQGEQLTQILNAIKSLAGV